jgi:hypothetical protein
MMLVTPHPGSPTPYPEAEEGGPLDEEGGPLADEGDSVDDEGESLGGEADWLDVACSPGGASTDVPQAAASAHAKARVAATEIRFFGRMYSSLGELVPQGAVEMHLIPVMQLGMPFSVLS